MSRRCCLALDLVNDAALITEYENYHAAGAVWPEVVDDIRASGIQWLEIWRVDNRCVMIIEVSDDYPRPRTSKKSAIVERWDALMARYQRPLPSAPSNERWTPMQRIYRMEDIRQVDKDH